MHSVTARSILVLKQCSGSRHDSSAVIEIFMNCRFDSVVSCRLKKKAEAIERVDWAADAVSKDRGG